MVKPTPIHAIVKSKNAKKMIFKCFQEKKKADSDWNCISKQQQ